MRLSGILLLLFALCGCAITRQQALELAQHDLQQRSLPLPRGYTVDVDDVVCSWMNETNGLGDVFPCYVIRYSVRGKELYEITIRQYTPYIRDFRNLRGTPTPKHDKKV